LIQGTSFLNKHARLLDKISGNLFLAGFLFSKLRFIPIRPISMIINTISLSAYFIGYTSWYLATLLYPSHPRLKTSYFGFAEFKQQYQAAALLGTVATAISFMDSAVSLPATWLFALSSVMWTISEYHKYKNPPGYDLDYSSQRQAIYLRYVLVTMAISLLTSAATTVAVIFPAMATASLLTSVVLGNLLTVLALYYCKKSMDEHIKPDIKIENSYNNIIDIMPDNKNEHDKKHLTSDPQQDENTVYDSPFKAQVKKDAPEPSLEQDDIFIPPITR
jgi:hypothetical protein